MPGEQKAKLTLRVSFSRDDQVRAAQSTEVRFKFSGTWFTYRRGGNGLPANEYVVPDPDDEDGGVDTYVKNAVTNLLALVKATITARNLPYLVSEPRDAGVDGLTGLPQVDFDVSALEYDPLLDLDFFCLYTGDPRGWRVLGNVATVFPLQASARVTDAGAYNSATGAVDIVVNQANGLASGITYVWADDATLPPDTFGRTKLKAGTYRCTVTDRAGASAVVTAIVRDDARLVVQVNATSTRVELVPSGGRAPYAFAWDDGSVAARRTGLRTGTYLCRVSDERGAFVDVVVVLSPYRFYWSQNPITLAVDAGDDYRLDPTTKPNLTFRCEVWLEKIYGSDVFEQVGQAVEQPADRDGRTVFEVQALLAPFLQHDVPAPGSRDVRRADGLFRRFFLQHAESFGDVPEAVPAVSLERNFVLLGGLNFYEARAPNWAAYLANVRPFLTWEPPVKTVLADQPEFLYFLVQQAPGAFQRQVRVHFTDGDELVVGMGGAADVSDFEAYCLPVGYAALNLAALATADRQVAWWEVFVTAADGTTPLSETRRYVLDPRTFPNRRFLLFGTSLGGMATYAATGEAQLDGEATGQEAALTLPPAYDPLLGDTAVQSRSLRPVVKLAGGARTRAQLLASQDLLLSRRVLLLSRDGQRWLPGFIKTKTVTLLDESKPVQVQELEFVLPTERLYTPALGPDQVTYATQYQP